MTALFILFILSLNLVYFVWASIKEIAGYIYFLISPSSCPSGEKITKQESLLAVAGFALEAIGVYLYYKVCAETVTDILSIKHPVENPVLYGVALLVTSLICAGGAVAVLTAIDQKSKVSAGFSIAACIVLIVYIILKAPMILP